jgi:hypothetical protein
MTNSRNVLEITNTTYIYDHVLWRDVFGHFTMFEWWEGFSYLEGGWDSLGKVRMSIDDGMGEIVTKDIDVNDIANAISINNLLHMLDYMDSETADAILQCAVLGEVVYG